MANILPEAKTQFVDGNGKPYAGGFVYFYIPSTTTFKNTWQDAAQTILNTNPVVLDGDGRALIFGSGAYRQQLYDVNNNLIWDQLTYSPIGSTDLSDTGVPGGAGLIGFDGNTLAQQLTNRVDRVCKTIAELRTLVKTTYTHAVVEGYYAQGDGGGGSYYYDSTDTTSADNGGTIIVASDGGRWKITPSNRISVKQFGAKGDGVANDTAAIQAAIDAGVHRLYVPNGNYVITSALNLTNRAAGDPFHMFGDAVHYDHAKGSNFICRTGTWIADFTGSQFTTFEDLCFFTDATTPSTKGFLYARSTTNNYAMYHTLNRVIIRLPSNPAASTVGTIALANNCAEHFTATDCWFEADTPYLSTLANEISLASVYTTVGNTIFSNTAQSFRMCTFTPTSSTFPAMLMYGVGSATFLDCVWIPINVGSPPTNGIIFRDSAQAYKSNQNIKIIGQIESFPRPFRFDQNSVNIDISVTLSNISGPYLDMFTGGVHENLTFRPSPLNNTAATVTVAAGASVTLRGGWLNLISTLKLVDSNLILSGTLISGGNLDMANPANFAVNATSSYRALWAADWLHFTNVYNPGSVTSGSSVGTTFAAAGVVVGDKVTVYPPYDLAGALLQAGVSSAGNIRLTIANLTGSTLTFGSGTWKYAVERATF